MCFWPVRDKVGIPTLESNLYSRWKCYKPWSLCKATLEVTAILMLLYDEERNGAVSHKHTLQWCDMICYIYNIYHNVGLSFENTLKQNAECSGLTFSPFHGNVLVWSESLVSAITLNRLLNTEWLSLVIMLSKWSVWKRAVMMCSMEQPSLIACRTVRLRKTSLSLADSTP